MAGKRLSRKQKLDAITGSGGLLVDIAAAAGVHRSTVRAWRDSDPDIAEAIEQERESTTDKAEGVIIQAIETGDVNAAKYWLSTIGKSRGFSTRQEVSAEVKQTGNVHIFIPDNGRDPDFTKQVVANGGDLCLGNNTSVYLPDNGRDRLDDEDDL